MTNPFATTCVYTILHPDRLSEAAKLRGPSTFVVRQRMVFNMCGYSAPAIPHSARSRPRGTARFWQWRRGTGYRRTEPRRSVRR